MTILCQILIGSYNKMGPTARQKRFNKKNNRRKSGLSKKKNRAAQNNLSPEQRRRKNVRKQEARARKKGRLLVGEQTSLQNPYRN